MAKVFVGLWVSEETRKKLKVACAVHEVNQGDVMELLLEKWLRKKHVEDDVKEIIEKWQRQEIQVKKGEQS